MVAFLSLIILGISADMITTTNKYYGTYFDFNALAIAVSVLSFSLAAMYVFFFLLLPVIAFE